MNKVAIIVAFSSLFFIAATFILIYVQLYDDYITAIDSSAGSYIIFLMVMAGVSLAILICIGGWLGYEAMYRKKRNMQDDDDILQKPKYSSKKKNQKEPSYSYDDEMDYD